MTTLTTSMHRIAHPPSAAPRSRRALDAVRRAVAALWNGLRRPGAGRSPRHDQPPTPCYYVE